MKALADEYRKLTPIEVELYDVVLILNHVSKKDNSEVIAVYKDVSTGKLYIPHLTAHLANPLFGVGHLIGFAPKINVRSAKGKPLEPNSKGLLYIANQLGTVSVIDGVVHMNEKKYLYKGYVQDMNNMNKKERPEIRNLISNNRFIQEINGATVIEGLIDFDIEM